MTDEHVKVQIDIPKSSKLQELKITEISQSNSIQKLRFGPRKIPFQIPTYGSNSKLLSLSIAKSKQIKTRAWKREPKIIHTLGGSFKVKLWTSTSSPEAIAESTEAMHSAIVNESSNSCDEDHTSYQIENQNNAYVKGNQFKQFKQNKGGSSLVIHQSLPCTFMGCSKVFRDRSTLRKHMNTHGPKTHICAQCNRGFTESAKLRRHYFTHTGEKPFSCTFEGCGRKFSLDFNLKAHQKVHTGESPYVCPSDNCIKRFTNLDDLMHHKRIENCCRKQDMKGRKTI